MADETLGATGQILVTQVIHLTLNTGHSRASPRCEVSDDVIERLRPLVRASGGPLPHPRGYSVQITREGKDALLTISATADAGRGAEAVPLVTCGLAIEDGPRVWRALLAPGRIGRYSVESGMPDSLPWLAVLLHPTAVLAGAALSWLGDAERCLAWALIEEARRVH